VLGSGRIVAPFNAERLLRMQTLGPGYPSARMLRHVEVTRGRQVTFCPTITRGLRGHVPVSVAPPRVEIGGPSDLISPNSLRTKRHG
jgi:hypothetical protein